MRRAAILLAACLFAGPALAQGTGVPGTGIPGTGTQAPGIPGGSQSNMGLPDAGAPGAGMPAPAVPDLGDDSTASPPPNPGSPGTSPGSHIYTGTDLPPVPGSAMPFTCPTVHGGRLLASSDIYDGTPLRGTLMPPRNDKWTLPPHEWPGNFYYISCEYGYDRPPLGIRLPPRVKTCARPAEDPTQVACSAASP